MRRNHHLIRLVVALPSLLVAAMLVMWGEQGPAPDHAFIAVLGYFALIAAFMGTVLLMRRGGPSSPGYGTCTSCGYDLRATPNRCPECGTVPKRARGTAA